MSDLGSDAGQSALSLSAKALELLLRVFEKVFDAIRRNPERKLTKLKLKQAKTDAERKEILDSLNGKTGYVNYQKLKRSGMELKPVGIYMTKDEMKEFSTLCKRYGVLFSGMTDSKGKNEAGVRTYELIFKASDLGTVSKIVDRLNDEKMLAGIDKRIAELEAKGEEMTEQDRIDVAALKEQREAIQRSYCDELNDEMSKNVIDRAVTGETREPLTLGEALNRLTGRHIDKDLVCIVADANDPSKYIKCHGYQAVYNDKEYIKTDYEVYRGSRCVLKTHDGRFDGRPEGYWESQKDAIQEAGGFSGTFFKFYDVVEYQKWAEATREQNAKELSSMEKGKEKDYGEIIKELEGQLDEAGARMQDGVVVDKQTGEPLALSEDMTNEQKAFLAEATVIGKQINNYQNIRDLEAEIAVAKAEILTADEATPERITAEDNLAKVQGEYNAALEMKEQLLAERKEINAVQAEQEVRNAPELEKAPEVEYLPEDKAKIDELEARIAEQIDSNREYLQEISYSKDPEYRKTMYKDLEAREAEVASMKTDLAQLKSRAAQNALNAEHSDDRRGERVNEPDPRQMNMEEAKSEIKTKRDTLSELAAKDNHGQDIGAKIAQAVKPKVTDSHLDR